MYPISKLLRRFAIFLALCLPSALAIEYTFGDSSIPHLSGVLGQFLFVPLVIGLTLSRGYIARNFGYSVANAALKIGLGKETAKVADDVALWTLFGLAFVVFGTAFPGVFVYTSASFTILLFFVMGICAALCDKIDDRLFG